MASVPNQDNMAPRIEMALGTEMHLEHQRATRIEHLQITGLSLFINMFSNPMRRENHHGTFRYLVEFIDKDNALAFKRFYNKLVMNNFMADIYRRAELFNRLFNHMNSAIHAGTKTTRRRQNNLFHNSPN